jgi:maltooligosyltrehalose trehalohydrolase
MTTPPPGFPETASLGDRLGARLTRDGVVFRAWTTVADRMSVVISHSTGRRRSELAMTPVGDGLHELHARNVEPGELYRFKLNGRELPDPYARRLPRGVHGPAEVVESRYRWAATEWKGLSSNNVIYELHVGTFTPHGSYRAAIDKLPELASIGVTAVEIMPLSSAAGTRGWGYDGVAHFAPFEPYGPPDELRALVDVCHALGLGVILDVVYNHFGPAGNYLPAYSPDYFTSRFRNPWGDAPNYANRHMRRLVLENASYWLTEFRMDGLRLDAIHQIPDPSETHILAELARVVHDIPGPRRMLFAEDERNDPIPITQYGLDALWADDFHHFVHVLLTGESDGYYSGYDRSVEALAQTIGRGWFYQGQIWPLTGKPRGRSAISLTVRQLVYCLQNHDQVGNRPNGKRLNHLVSNEAYVAASMLLLFLPATPLLFMGQEWGASSPFCYFTDHEVELGKAITRGRRQEFAHFNDFRTAAEGEIPDPQAESSFARSKLNWDERELEPHAGVFRSYRALLDLRKSDPVLSQAPEANMRLEVIGPILWVDRWLGDIHRSIFVNFGDERAELPKKTPLRVLMASSETAFAGRHLSGHAAVIVANDDSATA